MINTSIILLIIGGIIILVVGLLVLLSVLLGASKRHQPDNRVE